MYNMYSICESMCEHVLACEAVVCAIELAKVSWELIGG